MYTYRVIACVLLGAFIAQSARGAAVETGRGKTPSIHHSVRKKKAGFRAKLRNAGRALVAAATLGAPMAQALEPVQWAKPSGEIRTNSTLQVVGSPILDPVPNPHRPGEFLLNEIVRRGAYAALKDLRNIDDVRVVPWIPYPKMSIASSGPGQWDFTRFTPLLKDVTENVPPRTAIWNVSTIPNRMFSDRDPHHVVPEDPHAESWDYSGQKFADPTYQSFAKYLRRVFEYHMKGGMTDELGKRHESGLYLKPKAAGILNESDFEHQLFDKGEYNKLYDATVAELRQVDPALKFVGMGIAEAHKHMEKVEYFLDPANHAPGTPIDYFSYHFYAIGKRGKSLDENARSMIEQTEKFLWTTSRIQEIRDRLNPGVKLTVDELGTILQTPHNHHDEGPVPAGYFNLAASMQTYATLELMKRGVEVVGVSQLVARPGNYPTVAMVSWENGTPNARYHALKLVSEHIRPGDRWYSAPDEGSVSVFPILGRDGKKKLFLVNKASAPAEVSVPGYLNGLVRSTSLETGDRAPEISAVDSPTVRVGGFGVTVIETR